MKDAAMDGKNLKEAFDFISKIRAASSSSSSSNNLIKSFLQAFSNFQKGSWGIDEFDRQISSILENYPDLLSEFRTFRSDFDSNSGIQYVIPQYVLKRCTKSDQRAEALKLLFDCGKIGRLGFPGFPPPKSETKQGERKQRKRSPESELGPDKFRKIIRCSPGFHYSPDPEIPALVATPSQTSESEKPGEERKRKYESPEAELELGSTRIRKRILCSPINECLPDPAQICAKISGSVADKTERVTPSYRYIQDEISDEEAETLTESEIRKGKKKIEFDPDEVLNSTPVSEFRKGKKKTMIEFDPSQVLNSTLECKPPIDYIPKHRIKSHQELKMLKIEDSLFDLDMLLSTMRNTASSLEKLMKENNVGDVRKQMNGMMLRCITLLYANADEKVVR